MPGLIFSELPKAQRAKRTRQLIATHGTDVERWSAEDNFSPKWEPRSEIVASLIERDTTVLDLGCGTMQLKRLVKPGVRYIACDLIARDLGTLVCDLNKGELPDVNADIVTMLGVIEYVHDPAALLEKIGRRWPRLILTYNPSDRDVGRNRRRHGWFNDLTSATLIAMGERAGLRLMGLVPFEPRQWIYDFARRPAAG